MYQVASLLGLIFLFVCAAVYASFKEEPAVPASFKEPPPVPALGT